MSDKKISQLAASSTPLAGTEVLPIVQSGATTKVSVSNLTAGRNVLMENLGVGTAINPSYKIASSGPIISSSGANYFAGSLGIGATPAYALDVLRSGGAGNIFRAGQSGVSNGFTIATDGANLTYTFNTGNIVIGTAGKGIDFSADPSAAGMTSELLDDYEEGTWTPVVEGNTTSGAGTYTTQVGKYTRIGNRVFVSAYLVWTAHTGTGGTRISGLPFTVSDSTFPAISILPNNIAMTASNYMSGYCSQDQAFLTILQTPVGGGAITAVVIDTAGSMFISANYTA